MSEDAKIDLSIEGQDPVAIRSMLEDLGARDINQVKEKALTGLEIIFFAIMATQALANLIIRLLPLLKSGVVVDARGTKVTIRKDKRLARGSVTIISKDGQKAVLDRPVETVLTNFLGGHQAVAPP